MTTPNVKNNDTLLPRIQKVIASQLKRAPEQIGLNATLQNELGADSLDALEIIMSIEEEFDIHIEETAARKITTVKDIVDYVASKVTV